jgi:hypothetical protein
MGKRRDERFHYGETKGGTVIEEITANTVKEEKAELIGKL